MYFTNEVVASKASDTSWIMHHIYDAYELEFDLIFTQIKIHLPVFHFNLFGYTLEIGISKHVVFMWIAAAIILFSFIKLANHYKKERVPKGFGTLLEVLIVFVRDDIAKPTIGKGYEKFLPYLLTAFFFIMTSNYLGLIPYSATVTSSISVTATLSVFTFLVMLIGGISKNGFFGYFKGLLPHGLPSWLIPIMFVVELLSLFTKPFALAIRLFANMTAGHVVILSLFGLIFITKMIIFAPVSVAFSLFIYTLELLVCILQAYIFTLLSSLFIGMSVHQEH